MRYFGGKYRIAKPLSEFLNRQLKPNQPFIDLFCGSCNVVSNINDDRIRVANDIHPYLIDMYKALKKGWIPPDEISREQYNYMNIIAKNSHNPFGLGGDTFPNELIGFTGFACSYFGKWFGGYADEGKRGYRNFAKDGKNSILKKMKKLSNVEFSCGSYDERIIYPYSLVYCDIPYKNKTGYSKLTGEFDHDKFYEWCKKSKEYCTIYVFEYDYNVPDFGKIVWEYKSKTDVRNKNNERIETKEVLFTI